MKYVLSHEETIAALFSAVCEKTNNYNLRLDDCRIELDNETVEDGIEFVAVSND